MDASMSNSLANLGPAFAIGFSSLGSALGIGAAGSAAVGAWKKCFANNKPAPFLLAVFVGAPITQTFYGMIVMNKLIENIAKAAVSGQVVYPSMIGWGLLGGLTIGASAYFQGVIAAAASDAQAETGQGFTNYLMALGIIESVAIFVMVFILMKA
jgi:V/A-type H+-transporting ATPase subunit K